mmetsp:Transcript_113844/g.361872  ORF Transcript_113844/g.361872 Transcript_113844/m.361872 type:complete len:200 (-) Transcript_113844:385-984(-)
MLFAESRLPHAHRIRPAPCARPALRKRSGFGFRAPLASLRRTHATTPHAVPESDPATVGTRLPQLHVLPPASLGGVPGPMPMERPQQQRRGSASAPAPPRHPRGFRGSPRGSASRVAAVAASRHRRRRAEARACSVEAAAAARRGSTQRPILPKDDDANPPADRPRCGRSAPLLEPSPCVNKAEVLLSPHRCCGLAIAS